MLKMVLVLLGMMISSIAYGSENTIPAGIYEYVYEYNTDSLTENHYIRLTEENIQLTGQYYGTSDDFDEAREGYLPGFFSSGMKNLKVNGNEISFSLMPEKFFMNPVTPLKESVQNSPWSIGIRSNERSYSGRYIKGQLIIESGGMDKRAFTKIK